MAYNINPFYIKKPERKLSFDTSSNTNEATKAYIDRLVRLIPSEIIALYTTGIAIIPIEDFMVRLAWTIFCFFCVILVRTIGSKSSEGKPQFLTVLVSTISFVIWIYNGRGVFDDLGLHVNYIGALLMLAWTFLVPFFYQGNSDE